MPKAHKPASTPARGRANKADATRARKPRRDWKPAWLKAFELTGMVSEACKLAEIGRTAVYEARQQDEAFALAWADIEQRTTEAMEREAYRRAVEGVEKPVVSAGKHVTNVLEYSDGLLMFMLKARKPAAYRENVKVEHSGRVDSKHTIEIPDTADRRSEVLGILGKAGVVGEPYAVNGNGHHG